MGLFEFFNKKRVRPAVQKQTVTVNAVSKESQLEHLSLLVDAFLRFKNDYLTYGDLITLYITVNSNYKPEECELHYHLTVMVSDWWDSIMLTKKEQKEVFMNIFEQTSNLTFERDVLIAKSTSPISDSVFIDVLPNLARKYNEIEFSEINDHTAVIQFSSY